MSTLRSAAAQTPPGADDAVLAEAELPAENTIADDVEAVDTDIAIHGFVSQGVLKSTSNNFLVRSERGSFEFTEVGVNFTKRMAEDLSLGLQLFARDLGPNENYGASFDWFYLSYHVDDWLSLRAGRAKTPFGLYNESSDVDSARTAVLLPQAVYPATSRDFLLAVTGVHLSGFLPLGAAGALEYRAYGGTNYLETADRPSSSTRVESLDTPVVLGGRLFWETPLPVLRLGGSLQVIRIDGELFLEPAVREPLEENGTLPNGSDGLLDYELDALLAVGSIEYMIGELLIAAEYSRWRTSIEGEARVVIPGEEKWSERYYVLSSYHLTDWLTPGLYYSGLFSNVDDRDGRQNYQHDVAANLRFDLNEHWLFKLEGHYMRGTAGLSSALNGGRPLAELDAEWGLFLAKTTAYF